MTILDQLADYAQKRVSEAKHKVPANEIKRQALSLPKGNFIFETTLKKAGISFICECKKASPSKGLIAPNFPYLQIAKEEPERIKVVDASQSIEMVFEDVKKIIHKYL